MSTFDSSEWAKPDFVQGFVEEADRLILERRRMMNVLSSFYHHFLRTESICNKVLELGCGDGAHSEVLLKQDPKILLSLVDGSDRMLEKAKKRLEAFQHIQYKKVSFQELIQEESHQHRYHLIFSSLAIHHLNQEEKNKLFTYCFNVLEKNGSFINIDVVLANASGLEEWYLELWREWVLEQEAVMKPKTSHADIPEIYKSNKDNLPDTLDSQLATLKKIGFKQVDCYYKYGIFAVYGGRKV